MARKKTKSYPESFRKEAVRLAYLSMLISGWIGNKVYETKIKKGNNQRSAAFIGISLGIIILLTLTVGLHLVPIIGEGISAFYNRPSK